MNAIFAKVKICKFFYFRLGRSTVERAELCSRTEVGSIAIRAANLPPNFILRTD